MSIGSVFNNALTGLNASQAALKVISQNVANANTPGYVRALTNFTPQVIGGAGLGVSVESITRAADRFLAEAQRVAGATNGAASVRAELLDRAQLLFGDPNGSQTLFTRIDDIYTALQNVSVDPTSSVARRSVISSLQDALGEFSRVAQGIEGLRLEADQRVGEGIGRANDLLQRISDLNGQIALTKKSGGDITGAENARDQLVDELATLIDVRVTPASDGTIEVRTNNGGLLIGVSAARLSYTQFATAYGPPGTILINEGLPTEGAFGPMLSGGLIKGLMNVRDIDLPSLGESLGSLAAAMADELNRVHATTSGDPPASLLVGRNTGLLLTDSLNFTGQAIVGITDQFGNLARRLTIDFDAGTITSENPANVQSFAQTIDGFVNALNTSLQLAPAQATASFADGVLRLNTNSASGIVLGEVEGNESSRAGRGFSHFFGLNDLVRSDKPTFFAAGLSAADAHGLNAGGQIRFRITDANGRVVLERDVGVTGTSWQDFLNELNSSANGIGQYGSAALNSLGTIFLQGNPGYTITALSDSTERGNTGLGASDLFVFNRATLAARPHELRVDSRIVSSPSRLSLGKPDLTAAIGDRIIEAGDTRGAQALLAAKDAARYFPAAGTIPAQTTSIGTYASRLAGEAARMADSAGKALSGASAVFNAATERRVQSEGVSIDEELIRMTQFQQSYAASSRLIQAAKEMLDILLSLK
ncbi:MAG: flagellar hook-associated protein FlgK [Hyphomonadaceae bacterium]|nr:flagellar hook-associated protein FlgK [Hyphomonadaceae bacterium]